MNFNTSYTGKILWIVLAVVDFGRLILHSYSIHINFLSNLSTYLTISIEPDLIEFSFKWSLVIHESTD